MSVNKMCFSIVNMKCLLTALFYFSLRFLRLQIVNDGNNESETFVAKSLGHRISAF